VVKANDQAKKQPEIWEAIFQLYDLAGLISALPLERWRWVLDQTEEATKVQDPEAYARAWQSSHCGAMQRLVAQALLLKDAYKAAEKVILDGLAKQKAESTWAGQQSN
jgi:hypothetical protein